MLYPIRQGRRSRSRDFIACSFGDFPLELNIPHSLHADNDQDERALVPLLERAWQLRREGKLRITLPRRLVSPPD